MTDQNRTAAPQPLDWEDLRVFVALAAEGSLSAAARTLKVNHATVARRVAGLEAALGQALFDRGRQGYRLTAAGAAVLTQAESMAEAAAAIRQSVVPGGAYAGTVRLTTARMLADGYLVERLGGLTERYPGLELEVIAESRLFSLSRREADMALRIGRPEDSALLARRLGTLGYGFYAAPAWCARLAAGEPPVFVGYDRDSDFVAEAAWLTRHFPGRPPAFRSNSQTSQAAAARAGLGVALLPHLLATADGVLSPVALAPAPPSREMWLLIRPDMARLPRVRAVAEHLAAICRRDRPLLEGPRRFG